MKITKTLLFAWYFVATSNTISQAIATIGPFDTQQSCETIAQQLKGTHTNFPDSLRTTECWSYEEQRENERTITLPKEKEQSK